MQLRDPSEQSSDENTVREICKIGTVQTHQIEDQGHYSLSELPMMLTLLQGCESHKQACSRLTKDPKTGGCKGNEAKPNVVVMGGVLGQFFIFLMVKQIVNIRLRLRVEVAAWV